MKVFKMKQLSDHWWEVRRGVPTSSEFSRIITPAKGDLSTQADDYICELLGDIVCQNPKYFTEKGKPINSYAIQNGVDTEPEARRWYALEIDRDVAEVGFVMDDDLRFGCSPDGLLGLNILSDDNKSALFFSGPPDGYFNGHPYWNATAEAALEIKCPLPKTQLERLMKGGKMPNEMRPQVHGHLMVCGTQHGEWVSYSHGLDPIRVKFERDEYTAKVKAACDGFWKQFEAAKEKFLSGG